MREEQSDSYTHVCVCVQLASNIQAGDSDSKTKPPDSDTCVFTHTDYTLQLLSSSSSVVSQSNVKQPNKVIGCDVSLTSHFGGGCVAS